MRDNRTLVKNTAVLGASRVIERASTVLLTIIVARRLGASALGVYAAAMVFFNVVALAAEMGSNAYLVREVSRDNTLPSRYLVHLTAIVAALSLLINAIGYLVIGHLGYSPELTNSLYLILLAVFPAAMRILQEGIFIAHQRVDFITYCSTVGGITLIGVSLILLHFGYDVLSLIAAVVIEHVVITLVSFLFISRYISRIEWTFDLGRAFLILREMKSFSGLSLLCGLLSRPEILILSFCRGETDVGFYAAALRFVDLWQIAPQTYMTNLYPILARRSSDTSFDSMRDKSIKYLLALSLPLAAGTIVLARPIVSLIYGEAFAPSVSLMRILAMNIPLVSLWTILWRILAAQHEQGTVFRIQVVGTVVRLLVGTALIAWLGSIGAAVVLPAAQCFIDVFLMSAVHRKGTRIRLVRLGWKLAAASSVMALVAVLWILVPLSVVVYGLTAIGLRALSVDDLDLFRNSVASKRELVGGVNV